MVNRSASLSTAKGHAAHEPTVLITDARESKSVEINQRQRQYLFTMGLRTACFLGLVLTQNNFRWLFLVGAVVLPWIAVLFVNQRDKRGGKGAFAKPDIQRTALPSARADQVIDVEADDDETVDAAPNTVKASDAEASNIRAGNVDPAYVQDEPVRPY